MAITATATIKSKITAEGTIVGVLNQAPCAAATYKNDADDPTYTQSIPSGDEHVAPKVALKDTADATISTHNANEDIVAPDATALLKDTGGGLISTTPIKSNETKDISAPDGQATPVNSNGTPIGAAVNVKSGGTANTPANDTTVNIYNTTPTLVFTDSFPSGVAGSGNLSDIALVLEDSLGNNLLTTNKPAAADITQTVPLPRTVHLPFEDSIDDTTGLFTFTAGSAGTYSAGNANTTDDGASGTITYSINGGAYAAFPASQAFVAGNTVQAKRTVTGAVGFAQIGGVE